MLQSQPAWSSWPCKPGVVLEVSHSQPLPIGHRQWQGRGWVSLCEWDAPPRDGICVLDLWSPQLILEGEEKLQRRLLSLSLLGSSEWASGGLWAPQTLGSLEQLPKWVFHGQRCLRP